MSILEFRFHPEAEDEFEVLATSSLREEQEAAAQLLELMDVIESHPAFADRCLGRCEVVDLGVVDGVYRSLDVKIISELRAIAGDQKYMTNAVRRFRDLIDMPADNYRVFYAPENVRGRTIIHILCVTKRRIAYSEGVLRVVARRYQESI